MFKWARHTSHLIKVAYTLSKHDALMDLLDLFGDQSKALQNLKKFRTDGAPETRLVIALQDLGPSFIKIGQAMATRPDIVGPEVALDLMKLQDDVPPFSGEKAKEIIESDLGASIDELFKEFDIKPIAAASIAQVHMAKTNDGKKVAVKVLRPDIAKAFSHDLEAFSWIAGIAEFFSSTARRLRPTQVVETIAEVIALEMDLRIEAAAAAELKQNTKENPHYDVPTVDWDRTSRQVLTTNWVDGISFKKVADIKKAGLDPNKLAENLVQGFLSQALNDGFFHADLHQGNLFACDGNKVTAIDFGIMGRIDLNTRRGLADILYGFATQDYDRIAKAHFDLGYVPSDQDYTKFKQAIRAIGEPVVGKPLRDISAGRLLGQLFETTATFNMHTQPQLILLQKTMVTAEGVALNLNPDINMWEVSRPVIEKWVSENLSPIAMIKNGAKTAFDTLSRLPQIIEDVEQVIHQMREMQSDGARRRSSLKLFMYGILGGVIGSGLCYAFYMLLIN
ncbi:MAG: 2-polyprenylphenol 6-hydroxylase [Emcibacteraceae bacterium]|nr:2-polyprenylphenol 6-hydroxylase [Emcibacteraceae bacterium]MDG1997194.1 2-polyprenylphenol 6-hydroxylase [Emcibacteraceae bacterium]